MLVSLSPLHYASRTTTNCTERFGTLDLNLNDIFFNKYDIDSFLCENFKKILIIYFNFLYFNFNFHN